MNKTRIIGNWNEWKGKLKMGYAELTDNDPLYKQGREDELNGQLLKRFGKSKADIERLTRNH